MDYVLLNFERVDDAVIANAQSISPKAFQAFMRESAEARSHLVDFCFYARAETRRQPEKWNVETRVVNLERAAHRVPGLRVRVCSPAALCCSDF
jgi:hypothetical protein